MDMSDETTSKGGISTRSSTSKAEPSVRHLSKSISNPSSSIEIIADPSAKAAQKGDLYWSQIGSYPYWPCMVTPDPENQEISLRMSHFGKSYKAYHVRFFGDKGSRSWVKNSKLIPYEGRTAFDNKIKSMKNKKFENLYKKGLKNKSWHTAIEEADLVQNCQPENRFIKYENILENSKKLSKNVIKPARVLHQKGSKKINRRR